MFLSIWRLLFYRFFLRSFIFFSIGEIYFRSEWMVVRFYQQTATNPISHKMWTHFITLFCAVARYTGFAIYVSETVSTSFATANHKHSTKWTVFRVNLLLFMPFFRHIRFIFSFVCLLLTSHFRIFFLQRLWQSITMLNIKWPRWWQTNDFSTSVEQ